MRNSFYAAASMVALAASPGHAQTAVTTASDEQQPAETADNSGRLVEIIVTAQRRSQSIERVPVSVQVLSGESITAFRQTDLRSVASSVPNLVLTASPSRAISANIRGIGTSVANAGFEQTVALYVDGVYQPRPYSYSGALFDVDRIEVVKGTQGTLFGKNASVGAIGLYTRDPKGAFGGYLNASYDFTLHAPQLEGGINLPASETLRFRVAGMYSDQNRGWVRDLTTGKKFPTSEEYGIRGKGEWDVTDNLTVHGKLEYAKSDIVGHTLALVPGNVVGGGVDIGKVTTTLATTLLPDNGNLPGIHQRSDTQTIGATWNLGNHTLTALSGWTNLRVNSFTDFIPEASPLDVALRYSERFKQFTQELRFASDESQPFEYMAGLFYLDQTLTYRQEIRWAVLPADQILNTDLKTYSGYVQGKYKFTDDLSLTLGARVTREIKRGTLKSTKVSGTGVTPGVAKTTTFDWNAILDYQVVNGTRVYASISRGHKGPGFLNTVPGLAAPVVPSQLIFRGEKATNYEIGLKSRFFDGRARANLAVYNLDVKDYQGSELVPALAALVSSNIDVRSRGVEGELEIQIAPPLRLDFTGAYNDGIIKATGNQNINAPRWNANVNLSFTPELTEDFEGMFSGQLNYTSKFPNAFDLQPGNFTPGRTLLDLRAGIKHVGTGISLALIGKNVMNKRYVDFASGYPFAAANTVFLDTIAKPRTITLQLKVPFGSQ